MRKQDYLPQLIRSMSPSEKRYFRLYSGLQPGAKDYMKLYDLLEDGQQYDTAVISKKLKVTTKKLADEKEYLQTVLLRALRNYEQDINPRTELANRLLEADLLYRRGMNEFALSHLDKSYEKTILYEQYGLFIDYFQLRQSLVRNRPDPGAVRMMPEIFRQQIERLNELMEYKFLYAELVPHFVYSHDTDRPAAARRISARPLMQKNPEGLLSAQTRFIYYDLKNRTSAFATGAGSDTSFYAYKGLEVFDKDPALRLVIPEIYVQCHLVLADSVPVEELDHGLKMIDKAIAILDKGDLPLHHHIEARLRFNASSQKALLLYHIGHYAEFIEQVEKVLEYELPPTRQYIKVTLLYVYAAALLYTGQAEKALGPLREILKGNKTGRVDLLLKAMLLELMVQYDLQNYSLIPYSVSAIRKWTRRKNISADTSHLYLKWMLAISVAASSGEPKDKLKAFLHDINAGKIKIVMEELNIRYWLQQKLKQGGK
jgi:hypothetical protein